MKKRIQFYLTILLMISSTIGFSQGTPQKVNEVTVSKECRQIKAEIDSLKKEQAETKKDVQNLDRNFNVKEIDIKEYIQEHYENWITSHFTFTLSIVSILGFFLAIWGLQKIAGTMINKRVEIELEKHLKSNAWLNALKLKIKKQLDENVFKEGTKIHVISNDDVTESEIKKYLTDNGFAEKNISFSIGASESILSSPFDVLFINNKNNAFALTSGSASSPFDNLINQIKASSPDLAVLYFNDNGMMLPRDLNNGLNSSFANSLASLYHNLLDLMRYKYLVLDGKEIKDGM